MTPFCLKPKDFKISKPTLTSSQGSDDNETRIVSPIPLSSKFPIPIEDFTVPARKLPASVIPTCNGQSIFSERLEYAAMDNNAFEALTLILKR